VAGMLAQLIHRDGFYTRHGLGESFGQFGQFGPRAYAPVSGW
jgi:hypothetical protein